MAGSIVYVGDLQKTDCFCAVMVSIRVKDLRLTYKVRQKLSLAARSRNQFVSGRNIGGTGRNRYVKALDGISFELKSGDRLGLVGPNGAGKTTLLKVLHGVYEPTGGSVEIEGRIDALFNINLGFRLEATGRRNIELRGLICGWTKDQIGERIDDIISFSELGEFIDMPFKSYSQGMAVRLAFSIATSFEPEILLMDEWIGASDPTFRDKARERMETLTTKAGIIVLASHNIDLIRRTCNRILELENGIVNTDIGELDIEKTE